MKSVVVFCVIILSAGQALAAIKDCEELKSEIAAKLVAAGVSSFLLEIVDKDRTGPGRIIGSCQGGTKRIVRRMSFKSCEEVKAEIATKLTTAGISPAVLAIVNKEWAGAGKIVGSCQNGAKRIVRTPTVASLSRNMQADLPARSSVTLAYAIKDCEELRSEIAAKLIAAGVPSFILDIADKNRPGVGKIIGSCENGTKRIVRRR